MVNSTSFSFKDLVVITKFYSFILDILYSNILNLSDNYSDIMKCVLCSCNVIALYIIVLHIFVGSLIFNCFCCRVRQQLEGVGPSSVLPRLAYMDNKCDNIDSNWLMSEGMLTNNLDATLMDDIETSNSMNMVKEDLSDIKEQDDDGQESPEIQQPSDLSVDTTNNSPPSTEQSEIFNTPLLESSKPFLSHQVFHKILLTSANISQSIDFDQQNNLIDASQEMTFSKEVSNFSEICSMHGQSSTPEYCNEESKSDSAVNSKGVITISPIATVESISPINTILSTTNESPNIQETDTFPVTVEDCPNNYSLPRQLPLVTAVTSANLGVTPPLSTQPPALPSNLVSSSLLPSLLYPSLDNTILRSPKLLQLLRPHLQNTVAAFIDGKLIYLYFNHDIYIEFDLF